MTRPASGAIKFSDLANGQTKFNLGSWVATSLAGKGSIGSTVSLSMMYDDTFAYSTGTRFIAPDPAGVSSSFGDNIYISNDGTTALICGVYDGAFTDARFPSGMSGRIGAVWVYTRSGTTWTKQQKIVPADTTHTYSTYAGVQWDNTQNNVGQRGAISADGNTIAFMSTRELNSGTGLYTTGIWIYTRSGTTWTQQAKLFADNDLNGNTAGTDMDLSGDGDTLILGEPGFGVTKVENGVEGKASMWTRSGTTWTKQSNIYPSNWSTGDSQYYRAAFNYGPYNNNPWFGYRVSISTDGQTLALAGWGDGHTYISGTYSSYDIGAVWIYTRSGNTWTYQAKLVPNNYLNLQTLQMGLTGLDISSDGNTVACASLNETDSWPSTGTTKYNGAVWVWTRSGSTWTQSAKLTPTINMAASSPVSEYDRFVNMGVAIWVSADGYKVFAAASGFSGKGYYVFTRSGNTWTEQGSYSRTPMVDSKSQSFLNPGSQGFVLSKNGKYGLWGEKQTNGAYALY
jgi:hypothetical protein